MYPRNKCFVPGCNTGCNIGAKPGLTDPLNKKTLFRAPEDKILLDRWRRNIPKVGKYLIPGIFVCEVHFKADAIDRFKRTPTADGKMTLTRRSTPVLKPRAVPTVFPNLPTSLIKTLKKVQLPLPPRKKSEPEVIDITMDDSDEGEEMPVNDNEISSSHIDSENDLSLTKSKTTSETKSSSDSRVTSSTQDSNTIQREEMKVAGAKPSSTISKLTPSSTISKLTPSSTISKLTPSSTISKLTPSSTISKLTPSENSKRILKNIKSKIRIALKKKCGSDTSSISSISDSLEDDMDTADKPAENRPASPLSNNLLPSDDNFQILVAGFNSDETHEFTFARLKIDIFDIIMPTPQWSYSFLDGAIAFINWAWYYETRKKVIVTKNLVYRIFLRDKEIKIEGFEGPKSFEDVNELLRVVESIPVCCGLGPERGWSKNCTGHVPYREGQVTSAAKRKCDACLEEVRITPVVRKRQERKKMKVLKLAGTLSAERKKNKILLTMVQKLKRKNESLSKEFGDSEEVLRDILETEDNALPKILEKDFPSLESDGDNSRE